MTNRMAAPIFVKGIREMEENKVDRVMQAKLEVSNPGVKWGTRGASFCSMGAWNRGVKAEVTSMTEAIRVIKEGILWEGKRLTVELWRPGGQGYPSAPTGPRNQLAMPQGRTPPAPPPVGPRGQGHSMGQFEYSG